MTMKKCTTCGKTKDSSEFRLRKDTTGGHRAQCKSCMNAIELATRKRREQVERPQ
jgi:hypothetical protein